MTASTGIVTFFYTDLQGSTKRWERNRLAMDAAMRRHDAILRESIAGCNGFVFRTVGDGLCASFLSADEAVAAAVAAQRALIDENWGGLGAFRVRIAIHTGVAEERDGDYTGASLNRVGRMLSATHGGQILVSEATNALVRGRLPDDIALSDIGVYQFRDMDHAEHLFQVLARGLPAEFPPPNVAGTRLSNLPAQNSEFFGRETQLVLICQMLDSPTVRLLTLTGPGGIGKTRLALQVASTQLDRFIDGVYFVDLASVHDPDAVFEVVVRTIGIVGGSDERPLDALKQQLKLRRMLLLLDNFEHVMDAAGGVAELLQHCPDLNMLVTSRETLRLRGEQVFAVPPLIVPDGAGTRTLDAIAGNEAVRLFVERVRESQSDFSLTADNAPVIADICIQLEGLPLAIELAASRLKLFSPDELRDRLRTRLSLLRGGSRELPARHQTLRNTIAWSYELLDRYEQLIFQVLSVFSATRFDAVEDVVARLEQLQDVDVIDRLISLVDKSLIRSVMNADGRQLSMLETIREFAAERLAEEPSLELAVRQAHAEFFAGFVNSRRAQLSGPVREDTLEELVPELGNLMKAWRYWVEAGDLEQLNRMLDGLWMIHETRGWYFVAVDLASDLLGVLSSAPERTDHIQEEITVRIALARGLLSIQGYTPEVEEAYSRVLALSEEVADPSLRVPILRNVAAYYQYVGEFDKARVLGRELLNLAEQHHDIELLVTGHRIVAASDALLGEIPDSLDHLDQAIAHFNPQPRVGRLQFGPNSIISVYTTSAFLLWLTGFPDQAVERAKTAVKLADQLSHPFSIAYAYFHVGFLDLWRRDWEAIHRQSTGAIEVSQEHGYQIWIALGYTLQGVAMIGLGRHDEGLIRSEQGYSLYQGLETPPVFWPLVLYIRAIGFALTGRHTDGLEMIGQATDLIGDGFLYPELALVKGDLFLELGDFENATLTYSHVFEVAKRQGLRMSQLQAANRLVRLGRKSEPGHPGAVPLSDIYQTFTEGFEMSDLTEARQLLNLESAVD